MTGAEATEGTGAATLGGATGFAGLTGNLLSKAAKRCSNVFTSPMSMKKRIGR